MYLDMSLFQKLWRFIACYSRFTFLMFFITILTHNIFFNTFEKKPQFLNYNNSEIMDISECISGNVTKLNYLYIFFFHQTAVSSFKVIIDYIYKLSNSLLLLFIIIHTKLSC